MEKYELLNQIGDGTFGSVAKAVSKKTGQLVAIKKMKQKYYTWEECVKLPEVDVVRKIHGHPNVVKLREVIRENNELFFVFEYMDGDLLGVIKKAKQAQRPEDAGRGPALSYPTVKNYMRQILQSLAYLHKRGYFHRDLKPENLLIRRDGQDEVVKLADFGLVKEIRARPPFTDYVSTRWYRSPELLLQDRAYGATVDIWAAGCIMSELITTKPLFPGSNEVDQLFKIMNILGSPTEKTWPGGVALARKIRYTFPVIKGTGLEKSLPSHMPAQAIDLMSQMLIYDPKHRPTAEQCLQHPFFSVGIDESSGPSAAAIDHLSNAARRLQPNPQSAPAAVVGTTAAAAPSEQPLGKRQSLLESGAAAAAGRGNANFGGVSPQKFYMLGGPAKTTSDAGGAPTGTHVAVPKAGGAGAEDYVKIPKLSTIHSTAEEGAADGKAANDFSKMAGLKGLNLANLRPSAYKASPLASTAQGVSNPKAQDAPHAQKNGKPVVGKLGVDLDNLMDEFAVEISAMGANAERHQMGNLSLAASSLKPQQQVGHSSTDPVSALLNNSRYKKCSLSMENTSGQTAAASAKLASYHTHKQGVRAPDPAQQPVMSPSIKALMAKHHNSGALAFK